jgi:ATP-dependent helicase/DNAse subunit B
MSKKEMFITNSEIGTFTRCRYKWYLAYVMKLTPKKTPHYLEDGSVFHNALENLYEEYIKGHEKLTQDIVDDYNKRMIIIQGMASGYKEVYGDEYAMEWDLVEAEREFCIPLGDDIFIMGKKDKRIRKSSDGKIYIVEHKTAGQINSSYINKLPRDQQTLTYTWADSKENPDEPSVGVIYDVVKKPTIRQKVKETREEYLHRLEKLYTEQPEKHFYRETLRYNADHLKKFEKNLKVVTKHMRTCEEDPKNNAYRSWPSACDDFGGCPFKEICNKRSTKGAHMKAFDVRDHKHQELDRQGKEEVE